MTSTNTVTTTNTVASQVAYGNNNYVACIVGPAPSTGKTKGDFKSPYLRVLDLKRSIKANGVELNINIPTGSPQLIASLRDADGNIPQGITVQIWEPGSPP